MHKEAQQCACCATVSALWISLLNVGKLVAKQMSLIKFPLLVVFQEDLLCGQMSVGVLPGDAKHCWRVCP
jgi:hypothetical protein